MQTFTAADVHNQLLNAPALGGEAPKVCTISEQEVHVWTVDLSRIAVLAEAFSRDEHERAARLDSEESRWRFRAAHSALRMILARYLKLSPSSVVFGQTEFGKPFLINSEAEGLLFNLSYAGNLAVIAVARDREVGVDIEPVQNSASMDIAERCFSVAEIYTLTGLDPEARPLAYFNCWTRKEAYTKARGEGRSVPWVQFDMSLAPGVRPAMLSNRVDKEEISRWAFHDLQLPPGHVGTLVFESLHAPPRLTYFAFGW